MTGQKHSQKARQNLSISKQGKNHPRLGKQRALDAGSPTQLIEVLDLKKNSI